MSNLIDQGLAALAELGTRHERESEGKAAKELADFLARRKATDIRLRAKAVERDWVNLSLASEDPEDAAKLKRLVNMTAEEAAADDGLVVHHSDFDVLIPSHSRMGKLSGGTRIAMLLGTPG